MVWWEISVLFLSFLSSACICNVSFVVVHVSILDRYRFIEKLTWLFSLHKICSQLFWSKSEINLLLSKFLEWPLNILDFAADILEKKSFKEMNCGRWSENVDLTLPDSISSTEVEFEKMLSINVEVLEILVGRSIWGNKKLELSVSIKLLIESESSYFNKSILKSPNKKILLGDYFGSFISNGEIKSLLKSFIWSAGCLYMQPTIT